MVATAGNSRHLAISYDTSAKSLARHRRLPAPIAARSSPERQRETAIFYTTNASRRRATKQNDGICDGEDGQETAALTVPNDHVFYGVFGSFLGAFSPWRAMLYPQLKPSQKRCCTNFLQGMEDPATFQAVDSLVTGFYHLGSDCEELEAGFWVTTGGHTSGAKTFWLTLGFSTFVTSVMMVLFLGRRGKEGGSSSRLAKRHCFLASGSW
jgi:hypothetical protein